MEHADRPIPRAVGAEVERVQVDDGVPTLVFDGECPFCAASSRWISERWTGPGRAVPYQDLDRAALARLGLRPSDVTAAAWWVDERGAAWRGHEAIARSLAAAGGWRGVAGRALLIPPFSWLGSAVYPVVARHRRQLAGNLPACRPDEGSGA